MKLAVIVRTLAVAFSVAAGAGAYAYLDAKTAVAAPRREVSIDTKPPKVIGLSIGADFDAVTAAAKRAGLACEDASLIATMRKAHAKAKVDATTSKPGALAAHLKMLSDPLMFQVRYACEGVIANPRLGLRGANGTVGRLLFVHPNATQPLELVGFQRHHQDPAAATADLAATLDALEARYGEPASSRGPRELRLLEPIEREWHIGATIVRVRATWFGARGGSVSEEITRAPR